MANVSHELRTPVSIIKGFSETLIDDFESLSEKQKKNFLLKIRNNSKRLDSLIEDLLSLARLDAQEVALKKQTVNLSALIKQIGEDFKSRLKKDTPRLLVDLPSAPLHISGDPEKLISVFENLIENATVHAENLTRIKVQAKLDSKGESVVCKIEDDGQGFPKENWTGFSNAFTAWTRDVQGNGVEPDWGSASSAKSSRPTVEKSLFRASLGRVQSFPFGFQPLPDTFVQSILAELFSSNSTGL